MLNRPLTYLFRQNNYRSTCVTLASALILLTVVSKVSEASPLFPRAVPKGERVIAGEALFVEACKSVFADEAHRFGWSFGNSILTQSDRWGLIWRVDFSTPGSVKSTLVNRAICWGQPDGTVSGNAVLFGQRIPRLG